MFVKITAGLIVKPAETQSTGTPKMNTTEMNPEASDNAINAATDTQTDEARDTQTAANADADNADAAADANADDDDAADTDADVSRGTAQVTADKLTDLSSFGKVAKIAEAVQALVADSLAAIREDAKGLSDVADINSEAADARKDLWTNTLNVVGAIADQTADAPEFRGLIYNFVMGEFMAEKTRSTAKAYASTGRNVLIKLITDKRVPIADVKAASYAEVRTMLNPPSAEQAEAAAVVADLKKRIGFIARFAGKYGNDTAAARLARIAELVEREYNPVFRAKEADTAKEKAAIGIAELKQSSPRESGNVETVKPEAARPARTLHRSGASVSSRH